tara:strand:- start:516 stop:947 length:432 start_codon:yes stop_codon:yes gene_type:complete
MEVTKNRSILKTISYRIVGFINTFLISFFVISYGSENFDTISPLYVALIVLILKMITYYIHERVWNSYKYGRINQKVIRLRSFFKSLTWRLAASTITFFSAIFITSNLDWTKSIIIYEIMSGLLIYYIHERVWNKTQWGRIKL